MKNIQFIILLSMFIGFTSCEIENKEEDERLTEAGKIIYDETVNTIEHYIWVLNFAQKIDFYLQSEGTKRLRIRESLFKDYSIIEGENSIIIKTKNWEWQKSLVWIWGITSDNYWEITRSSTGSLDTPSSQWSIKPYYDNNQIFQITAQDEKNTWNVLINNCYREDKVGPKSNAYLQIQMQSNRDFSEIAIINKYSVKMVDNTLGSIEYDLSTKYNITEPIVFEDNGRHKFTEGEIAMEVTRSTNNADQAETDNIRTEILPNGDVSITFRGITEIWD